MLQLTDTQKVKVSVTPIDAKGAPAPVQSVTFVSSDETVASVSPDPNDPNGAIVVAGFPGVAQIQVTADADLGDSVANITGTLDITVVGGQAVSLTITAGTPEQQA